ncbi:hypothetical protein [Cupriavidus basilensis]|uniref:Toxic anion resistance protein n=1 Tax=Cupriavidus basilensis TaxID=68895 RepID=A0A643FPA2_9BURK|nr:hypothetical protein [Cupriavidus basilensis]QOT78119.1 hypothetical protein F7R26_008980 [Cupriavidus basilensis]
MQPTAITAMHDTALSPNMEPAPGVALPMNFPVMLEPAQLADIENRVAAFHFAAMPQAQVAALGAEPTLNLNRVLDGFLARINKADNPQLFKLVDALNDAVAKEKLGELADAILNAKPGIKDRIIGLFSKKAMQRAMDKVYEDLARIAKLKSKTLSDEVNGMENKLRIEMNRLNDDLQVMDAQKAEYRKSFVAFAQETAFLHNALKKAQAEAPALLAAAGQDISLQQEIQDKLQALESVALAREAMMTKLPAEQLVIRQLQNAGVSTLQELIVTMGDRFASIRMTLLTIHGAQMVQNVQRLGQSGANLDKNLQEVRSRLMQNVVATAATAPGNNRLDQANNLKRVVADTQALQSIVQAARATNQAKFEEARSTMSQVRQDLLNLGRQLNPAATVAPQTF